MDETDALQQAIAARRQAAAGPKDQCYIDKFWNRQRRGGRLSADVEGNHGTYHVSVALEGKRLTAPVVVMSVPAAATTVWLWD